MRIGLYMPITDRTKIKVRLFQIPLSIPKKEKSGIDDESVSWLSNRINLETDRAKLVEENISGLVDKNTTDISTNTATITSLQGQVTSIKDKTTVNINSLTDAISKKIDKTDFNRLSTVVDGKIGSAVIKDITEIL